MRKTHALRSGAHWHEPPDDDADDMDVDDRRDWHIAKRGGDDHDRDADGHRSHDDVGENSGRYGRRMAEREEDDHNEHDDHDGHDGGSGRSYMGMAVRLEGRVPPAATVSGVPLLHAPLPLCLFAEASPRSPPVLAVSSIFAPRANQKAERVCDTCSRTIDRVVASEATLRMLLANPYIDLHDLAVMKCVSVQARAAADFLQKKWARIGKHWFDTSPLTDAVAAVMLQQNAHLLTGHPQWELVAARVHPQGVELGAGFPTREAGGSAGSCRTLGCHSWCRPELTCGQCVAVLMQLPQACALRARALARLDALAPRACDSGILFELTPYVPTLVWLAAQRADILASVVLPALAKSDEFAFLAYFCARGHPHLRFVKASVCAALSALQAAEIAASEAFLNAVLRVLDPAILPAERLAVMGDRVTAARPFLPGSAQYRVVAVDASTVARVQSSTRPWVLHCMVEDVVSLAVEKRTVMVKSEGVWNDLAVVLVQRQLLAADPTLELEPYHVVPLGLEQGLVMFVKDCRSLFDIEQDGSILQWLTDSNPAKACVDVQRTFMRSCAATCILSRLLGFGDRHLQNILCSGQTGRLVHVDFSYLWSEEPAVSRHRIWLPEQTMRLTPGMMQVFRTHHYREFLDLCATINRTVRAAATDLYYVCRALQYTSDAKEVTMQSHFTAFMLPYTASATDADTDIVNVIEYESKTEPSPLASVALAFLRYLR